eukprot:TRINITY_DN49571_c0_g1_i1.p1 TRINITY_DN49571_c0_g1~~TRINITY_DN49571_c0_g1_i1.p1  ORF type:complete len:158 (-),score=7.53 TRINITY_DN49571_c0_g1_i1:22-495(-)
MSRSGLLRRVSAAVLALGLFPLGPFAAYGAPLPIRTGQSSSVAGKTNFTQTMLVKLDLLSFKFATAHFVWKSLMEDAGLLAQKSGAHASSLTSHMIGDLYLVQSDLGGSAGLVAAPAISNWLSRLEDETHSLSGYSPVGEPFRPGLQRLARLQKVIS